GLGAWRRGASVLLVLGSERLLLIVLAPGVLGSAAFLALGRPPQLEYAVWAALAATPLLAVGLALICTSRGTGPRRGGQPVPGPAPGRLLPPADLIGPLPSARRGLVAARLAIYPVRAR